MLYYSAAENTVCDDQVHGTRMIWVVDDAAQKLSLSSLTERESGIHEALESEEADDVRADLQAQLAGIAAERAALIGSPMQELFRTHTERRLNDGDFFRIRE